MSTRLGAHCRRAFLAALFLAPLASLASLAPARAVEPAPRIILAEASHDFGDVEEGVALTWVFRFRNDGDRVLEAKGG